MREHILKSQVLERRSLVWDTEGITKVDVQKTTEKTFRERALRRHEDCRAQNELNAAVPSFENESVKQNPSFQNSFRAKGTVQKKKSLDWFCW